jgi:hypothetical protein
MGCSFRGSHHAIFNASAIVVNAIVAVARIAA